MISFKNIFFTFILAAASLSAQAQGQGDRQDRLRSAKIGFITSRLNLTPKQAESFWPLFNEFDARRKAVRDQMRSMRLNSDTLSEKESFQYARTFIGLREQEVKLEKEYLEKFSKVLTGRQLLTIVNLDREFTKMILARRLGDRANRGPVIQDVEE